MNKILKNKYDELCGEVGKTTSLTYADDMHMKIGDLVYLDSPSLYRKSKKEPLFVCHRNGISYVNGCYDLNVVKGEINFCESIITVKKYASWDDVEDNFVDSSGVYSVKNFYEPRTYENNDLLYFITSKFPMNREERDGVEQKIKDGVLIINSQQFVSAKTINQKTGEVTDLMTNSINKSISGQNIKFKVLVVGKYVSTAKEKLNDLLGMQQIILSEESNTMEKVITKDNIEYKAVCAIDKLRGLEADVIYLDNNLLTIWGVGGTRKITESILHRSVLNSLDKRIKSVVFF